MTLRLQHADMQVFAAGNMHCKSMHVKQKPLDCGWLDMPQDKGSIAVGIHGTGQNTSLIVHALAPHRQPAWVQALLCLLLLCWPMALVGESS